MSSPEPITSYTGYVKNGVVVVKNADDALAEGVEVRVQIVNAPRPTLAEQFKDFIGKAEGLPADAASRIDDYLYGGES